jgi:hypothetical protein
MKTLPKSPRTVPQLPLSGAGCPGSAPHDGLDHRRAILTRSSQSAGPHPPRCGQPHPDRSRPQCRKPIARGVVLHVRRTWQAPIHTAHARGPWFRNQARPSRETPANCGGFLVGLALITLVSKSVRLGAARRWGMGRDRAASGMERGSGLTALGLDSLRNSDLAGMRGR